MTSKNGSDSYTSGQAAKYKAKNADFPLRWHPRGGWCKKVRGRVYYWGKVTPEAAHERYLHERDYLERGELPPAYDPKATTVRELCNEFLTAKETLVETGELSQRSFDDYHRSCGYLVKHFGANRAVANLRPMDFIGFRKHLAKGRGVVALKNEVNRIRVIFKFAYESELIPAPVRYGDNFKRPDKGTLRKHRNKVGRQDFAPAEVKSLLDATKGQLHAMLLLGINCGLGNKECGTLTIDALDLDGGWLNYHREKTGALRRAPLWRETIKALKAVIGDRTEGLVFRTKFLNAWSSSAITHELRKVLVELDMTKRQRVFYGLRRTFRTIADNCRDDSACNLIMGHTDDKTMGDLYVQAVDDKRLKAVSDHVRLRVLKGGA